MTFQEFFDTSWVSLLVFVLSLVFGIRLMITKDPTIIRGKKDIKVLKNPEAYSITAAKLLFFMAGGSLVMTALLFITPLWATIESMVVLVAFLYLWHRMDKKYGPI